MDRRERHRERVRWWVTDRVERASLGIPHPVYDFLFDYYSYRPAYLERWSPGAEVDLLDTSSKEADWEGDFVDTALGSYLPATMFPGHRATYLAWALRYLRETSARSPSFRCFGLHEWAMVYESEEVRHSYVPLRLSKDEIADVVRSNALRCTHYDAYRFFTPSAVPLNRYPLSRESTPLNDQRGCIHVTMDLYRFAIKISPWCPAELLADAFLLAADARAIDMRASPYDLRAFGFEPIAIETPEGREVYIGEQHRLADLAIPVRARLIEIYQLLASFVAPATNI